MKIRLPYLLLFTPILMLLTAGCTSSPTVTPAYTAPLAVTETGSAESTPPGLFSQDEIATLASLQQIDDLPFYVMHYVGDYSSNEMLGLSTKQIPLLQPVAHQRSPLAWGCTVFAALDPQGERLLGRNFDWLTHPALLLFTDPPDGYASVSMVDADYLDFDGLPLNDSERRGLLSAPFLPFDGMNEQGLSIGMMAVPHSEGGDDPGKATLGDLQVMRLLLDYARTVDEALDLLDNYNIDFSGGPPIHYLLADRSGAAAVVEFIGGKPQVVRNSQPWLVSTNFLLDEEKTVGAGSSCWRYNRAYSTLESAGGKLSPAQAMNLLQDVSQGGDYPTIWSVVYNMNDGTIQVVTRKDYNRVNKFQLEMAH